MDAQRTLAQQYWLQDVRRHKSHAVQIAGLTFLCQIDHQQLICHKGRRGPLRLKDCHKQQFHSQLGLTALRHGNPHNLLHPSLILFLS